MKLFYFFCIMTIPLLALAAKKRSSLHEGDKAPDFTLQDETSAWRSLSEFKGKNVVLFFYPYDNTPGCTTQACSFRDNNALYAEHNIVVLGINFNSPSSHAAFKAKNQLPFILLTDSTGKVTKAYGAKSRIPFINNYAPNRVTFLIDTEGKIVKKLRNINLSTYAEEVLKEFGYEV